MRRCQLLTFVTIGVKRTKLRLVRCRARKTMTDRERMKDARLDNNLVDVPRIPAPWDVPVLDPASVPPPPEPEA